MKTDTTNESPKYWENILSQHALSEKQLGMDVPDVQSSEAEEHAVEDELEEALEEALTEFMGESFTSAQKREVARPVTNANPDFEILRTKLDGKDRFMQGHQIKKVRGRVRENHDWAFDDEKVQTLINGAKGLNKWRTNFKHRLRAARWAGVIHYYHRMGLPRIVVAKELNVPERVVKGILKRINRLVRGRDSGNRGERKRPLPLPLC